jgi:Protein of unknown function (DUF1566)
MMHTKAISSLLYSIFICTIVPNLAYADERCGLATKKGEEPISRRFEILAEHNGRAFIDMRTCLVWDLYPWKKAELSLDRAMEICSALGQGGDMGWQIPTTAELTSLNSENWSKQDQEFVEFKLPPNERSETPFWTVTPWLGKPSTQAGVIFSARTTLVVPLKQDGEAAVWCVRGYLATELR